MTTNREKKIYELVSTTYHKSTTEVSTQQKNTATQRYNTRRHSNPHKHVLLHVMFMFGYSKTTNVKHMELITIATQT